MLADLPRESSGGWELVPALGSPAVNEGPSFRDLSGRKFVRLCAMALLATYWGSFRNNPMKVCTIVSL